MLLESIYLAGFRNLVQQEVNFSPKLNFILGKNAQGKTNLLELIYLISHGKSFRSSKLIDLINWNQEEAYLKGKVSSDISDSLIEIHLNKKQKSYFLNSKKLASFADLIGVFRTVCFTPEDLALVRGQPGTRRTFIDRHLVDLFPEMLTNLVSYNRAVKSKNKLLKTPQVSYQEIHPWNTILADNAALIIKRRKEYTGHLEQQANLVYQSFAKTDDELKLTWKNSIEGESSSILEKLEQEFPRESLLKQATLGPHRDDLIIDLNAKRAGSYASQGQTRSIALALKFSIVKMIEEKYQHSPVILLDDLDSELDRSRAADLYSLLFSEPRQIFITGTEIRQQVSENKANLKLFGIEKGLVKEL